MRNEFNDKPPKESPPTPTRPLGAGASAHDCKDCMRAPIPTAAPQAPAGAELMSGETECCCRGTVAGESGSRPGVLIELLEPEDEAACSGAN